MKRFWVHLMVTSYLIILLICLSPVSTSSFQWEDEDSVIIEALTPESLLKRRGGKFPFTWPWKTYEGNLGRARADPINSSINDPDFTCYTTLGEEGSCATLRECYPMLYSTQRQDGVAVDNVNLIDTLKSISGPCDMPNYSKFRIGHPDFPFFVFTGMPNSLICCPSRMVHQEEIIQIPALTSTQLPPKLTTTAKSPTALPSQSAHKAENGHLKPSPVSIPDAVAAHFHREHTCGHLSEKVPEGMSPEESTNRFPWIVALAGNRGHFCAGSLIDQYNVLTSASCTSHMTSEDVSNLQVYLGDYKLHTISDGPLIVRKVARVIYHRGFDNQTLRNDIALLRFKLPAPLGTPRVLPVCLPKKTFKRRKAELKLNLLVGMEAILAGWGRTWNPSPIPILQKTKMVIWTNEDCRIKYGYLARSGITDHMLCAYPPRESSQESEILEEYKLDNMNITNGSGKVQFNNSSNNSISSIRRIDEKVKGHILPNSQIQDCIGDTGGPLVVYNEDGRYEQVGIVSWNIGCSHYPYIHTRVGSYLNWIEKNRHR